MALKRLPKDQTKGTKESPAPVATMTRGDKTAERQKQNDQRFEKGSSVKIGAKLTQLALSEIAQDPSNARTEFISIGLRRQMTRLFADKWVADPASTALLESELDSLAKRAHDKCDTVGQREIRDTLSELWELAIHLKTNELMQPFAVRSDLKGSYIVAFGNRRFLALCIAHGEEYSAECLSYDSQPTTPNVKRFVENIQRTDLPLRAKLKDFSVARDEIAGTSANETEIALVLGLPRSSYFVLKSVAQSSPVMELVNEGTLAHLAWAVELSKFIGKNPDHEKKILSVVRGWEGALPQWSVFLPVLKKSLEIQPKKPTRGRRPKISVPGISTPMTLKRILSNDVLEKPGWRQIDWENDSKENVIAIQKLLKTLIQEMSEK